MDEAPWNTRQAHDARVRRVGPTTLEKPQWDWFCGFMGHPICIRVGTRRLECACGRVQRPIIEEMDEPGLLTAQMRIAELEAQLADQTKEFQVLQYAIADLALLAHVHACGGGCDCGDGP